MKLIKGDCLLELKGLPDKSVDMVLTDPPYGTTACKWDVVIPFEPMWSELKRIVKPNGAICLFGSEPFSSHLRMSNLKMFKYDWIWEKQYATNFMGSKNAPLKYHENISVFSKNTHFYNPQIYKVIELEEIEKMDKKSLLAFFTNRLYDRFAKIDRRTNINNLKDRKECHLGKVKHVRKIDDGYRNPKSIIKISGSKNKNIHPTQKPVALLEYLIKTYTLEGETVLDFTMGSGSTGVACVNLNRKFIGIEKDNRYFEIAKERLDYKEVLPDDTDLIFN